MEQRFQREGFAPFVTDYLARWMHTDQQVQVSKDDHGGASDDKVPAVIKGLTATGCLLAESPDGRARYELFPDGNSFDFLSGLLKRKL